MMPNRSRHSSAQEASPLTPKTVCLRGGGRWSRVLLGALHDVLGENAGILWVTERGYEHAKDWAKAKGSRSIEVLSDFGAAVAMKPDAAIIASASHRHAA